MQPTHPTRPNPVVYEPVGQCIYCGVRAEKLNREHVIPLGLDGGFVLPNSSCGSCGKITGDFEQICLRKNFGAYRRHSKLSSGRHRAKHRPLVISVINPDGTFSNKTVSLADYPAFILLPKFDEPGLLTERLSHPLIARFESTLSIADMKALEEQHGGKIQLRCEFDMLAFAKMLTKIAHSMAVGELGAENFEPLAPRFILGKDNTVGGGLIGQSDWFPSNKFRSTLHHIGLHLIPLGERHLVGVGIQLFCRASKTTYTVIAGKLTPTPSILRWKGMNNFISGSRKSFIAQYGLPEHPQSA